MSKCFKIFPNRSPQNDWSGKNVRADVSDRTGIIPLELSTNKVGDSKVPQSSIIHSLKIGPTFYLKQK